ncbi:MAG: winged helix-turn-helix domain-containing protein [Limnobacter sp.]|uniref:winged helix-turn-helix domain-containing protein n=1 Tax=Limnobacter sp. TaxID=2003368 RepID=UPI00391DA907
MSEPACHILLVEDDPHLQRALDTALRGVQYLTTVCDNVVSALQRLGRPDDTPIDLVLLDLGLQDGDGSAVLDWLQQNNPAMPVMVLSAQFDEARKIRLLDQGARDYLVKPFGTAELLARIRIQLRLKPVQVEHPLQPSGRYSVAGLDLDESRHQVSRDGHTVHLTPKEFKLLALLASKPGQVWTHSQLLSAVWGPDHINDVHYLRLYMAQLRGKLEDNPTEPRWIHTELGVGYRIAAD